jgi:hypothetical protein
MRTTVTLDPDVEAMLRREMRRLRTSFKAALNGAVRDALAEGGTERRRPQGRFRVNARDLRARPGVNDLNFNRLLDELEIEDWVSGSARRQQP